MSRATSEGPPIPEGQPTMSEIEVYRFCRSLLDWEGVHLLGEERVGENLRVLLTTDDGKQACATASRPARSSARGMASGSSRGPSNE